MLQLLRVLDNVLAWFCSSFVQSSVEFVFLCRSTLPAFRCLRALLLPVHRSRVLYNIELRILTINLAINR